MEFSYDYLKNLIHIVDDNVAAGSLKQALPKGTIIRYCPYDFQVNRLPQELGDLEWEKCKVSEYSCLYDKDCENFFSLNFNEEDTIVVWHSNDTNSHLLFWFIAKVFKGKLFHINVSEIYKNTGIVGELTYEQLNACFKYIKRVKQPYRKRLINAYNATPLETFNIRIIKNHQVTAIPIDYYIKSISKNIKCIPHTFSWVCGNCYAKLPMRKRISYLFMEYILLCMIVDGKGLTTEIEWRKSEIHPFPIYYHYNSSLIFKKKDLRKAYFLKVYKSGNINNE